MPELVDLILDIALYILVVLVLKTPGKSSWHFVVLMSLNEGLSILGMNLIHCCMAMKRSRCFQMKKMNLVCRHKQSTVRNEVTYHIDDSFGVVPFLLFVFEDCSDNSSTEVLSICLHGSG